MQQLAFDLFAEDRLPRKPYCSNDLESGLMIRPLETALAMRYIQPNRPGMQSYLAFDVDRPEAGAAWIDRNVPRPSFVIKNPENGHAHYLYVLESAVCTTSAARLAPLRYLEAIERAIRHELDADVGYCGLIIKNPVHRHWQTIVSQTVPYSLADLANHLDLTTKAANSDVMREIAGLGRNCNVFDGLRFWAYKAVAGYWRPNGETAWLAAVKDHAHSLNLFAEPLQYKEVNQIAKSVGKWVWKRFSPRERQALIERTHAPAIQAVRGQKKGAKRRDEWLPKVLEMKASGMSQGAIARETGISQQTIGNWLKRASTDV